jgi:hypothetical protein
MFQAGPPSIIRGWKLYTQHRVLARINWYLPLRQVSVTPDKYPMLCIQFWAPDDGRRTRLKRVEHFTEINTLCNVATCWLYLKIHLRCTDPWKWKVFSLICFLYLFYSSFSLLPLLKRKKWLTYSALCSCVRVPVCSVVLLLKLLALVLANSWVDKLREFSINKACFWLFTLIIIIIIIIRTR